MSYYFVSTLHKSYCIKDAFLMAVSADARAPQTDRLLTLVIDGKIECWDTRGPFVKRVLSRSLNCAPKQAILISNTEGQEDGLLLVEANQVTLVTITLGEIKPRSQLKTATRRDLPAYDYLLITEKQNGRAQYLVLGDKTSQLLVISIAQEGGYPTLVASFLVQLDAIALDLFPSASLIKDQGNLIIGVVAGNQELPMQFSLVEIDPASRSVVTSHDLKEACIRTKEGPDIFQEKIFRVTEPLPKCLLTFCSHSIKAYRFKDSSLQKVAMDRFKLPQVDSIFVERLPNTKTDSLIYLMATLATVSKSTFLYLVEIPSSLALDKIAITFLGSVAPLFRPPVVLDSHRVLLLSEVESSEIVEICETKQRNPQRPFLLPIHKFDNFGIVQQIDIDRGKKQLLLNSYKQAPNLQSFQKGVLLESVSQFKVDLSQLKRVQVLQPPCGLPHLVFYFPARTSFYHFGANFQLYHEKKLEVKECAVHFQAIDADQFYLVTPLCVKVLKLWGNPEVQTQQDFAEEETILAADSFCSELFVATENKLKFYTYSQRILALGNEVDLQAEPKLVRCMHRKVFVAYWTEEYLDSFGLAGNNHQRISIGVKGVHSMNFFYTKMEDKVFVLGLTNGSIVQKVIGNDETEKSTQILVVGKKPVLVREIGPAQFVAISDESALLSLSNTATASELVPLCHPEMTDLQSLTYQNQNYYFITSKNSISFNVMKNGVSDNCRLREIKLADTKPVDRFFNVENMLITCHSDLDLCAAEIAVHDLQSSVLLSKVQIPVGQIETMVELKFQERSFFLVGLSTPLATGTMQDFGNSDNLTGRLKMYLLRKGELVELLDTAYEKPVRGIYLLEGGLNLLVNVGYSTLKVLKVEQKLKKLPDKSVEITIPQLKEIHQQKFFFLIDNVSVMGNYILLTDYYWMAHVILFENLRFPRFKSIGRLSSVPHEIIGAELISPTHFAVSDKAGNFMVYSLADVGNTESDFIEFQERNLMYLGEQIFSFKKDSREVGIQFTDQYFAEISQKGSLPFLVLGGCSGGLYAVYEIPRKAFNLLEDLQRAMLLAAEADSSLLRRREFRKVTFKNKKTKLAAGIIDGDVLFPLLHMADDEALQVVQAMKHLNKPSLSTLRNLLRFLESSPVN